MLSRGVIINAEREHVRPGNWRRESPLFKIETVSNVCFELAKPDDRPYDGGVEVDSLGWLFFCQIKEEIPKFFKHYQHMIMSKVCAENAMNVVFSRSKPLF
jgi:hypothetical protein